MATPDEIKKGLEYCGHQSRRKVCHKCPFNVTMEDCIAWMASDALAYIQQLEAANAELLTKVKQLEAKCHQLERERDAAVEDMSLYAMCEACKRGTDRIDAKCPFIDDCQYGTKGHFEWRGVKEE